MTVQEAPLSPQPLSGEAARRPPEEARRVAGGPSEASDRRLTSAPDFTTAAAVAEGIRAVLYLIRDTCRCRGFTPTDLPVVSRFARDHRLPYVTPSGVDYVGFAAARVPYREYSVSGNRIWPNGVW